MTTIKLSIRFTLYLIALIGLAGCETHGKSDLTVKVVTDLVAVAEFERIETAVLSADNAQGAAIAEERFVPEQGTTFVRGVDVATFEDVSNGDVLVRVRAKKANGALVAEQFARIKLSSTYTLTVAIDRQCLDVDCSAGTPGNATAIACYMGQCVDPRCKPDDASTIEFCADVDFCESDAECPATAACATQMCADGVCIAAPNAESNDGCANGFYCDISVANGMCRAFDNGPQDAGVADAAPEASVVDADVDAAIDAAPDAQADATPDMPPGTCGNGVTEWDEACDDNNDEEDDDCSNDCRYKTCYVTNAAMFTAALANTACRIIMLADGTYAGHFSVSRSVKINGASQSGTILDGTDNGRVLNVTGTSGGFSLSTMTIQNGNADQGGGLRITRTATISNVHFQDNAATAAGGALQLNVASTSTATLFVTGCKFSNNSVSSTATPLGGAIHARGGSLEVNTCNFNNNVVTNGGSGAGSSIGGGAIAANGTHAVSIQGSEFLQNQVTSTKQSFALGGAIYVTSASGGTFSLSNTNVHNNGLVTLGDAHGGALYVSGGASALVSNATFDANSARGASVSGGAIHAEETTLTSTATDYTLNELIGAPSGYTSGGALDVYNASLIISEATIAMNVVTATQGTDGSTTAAGGGIAVSNGALVMQSSVVKANALRVNASTGASVIRGGGIYIWNNEGDYASRINGSAIVQNYSAFDGAASGAVDTNDHAGLGLFATSSGTAHIELNIVNSTIGNNTASTDSPHGNAPQLFFVSNDETQLDVGFYNATVIAPAGIQTNSRLIVAFTPSSTAPSPALSYLNSILSSDDNGWGSCSYSPNSVLTSSGYNVMPASCLTQTAMTTDHILLDVPSESPGLAALMETPAGMPRYAVMAMSPAINHGNPSGCVDDEGELLTHDSIGQARVGTCDSGAAEYAP